MSDTIFKTLLPNEIIKQQKVIIDKLFVTSYGIGKPYNASNNITITTSSLPSDNLDYYTKINFVVNDDTNLTYFSTVHAESASYGLSLGSSATYWSLVNQLSTSDTEYSILTPEYAYESTSSNLDVIALSREYYRDSINQNNFAVFIHTGSGATTSSVVSNYRLTTDGILGLYPSSISKPSDNGDKVYLYPIASSINSSILYAGDTLVVPTQAQLDKTKPYGEMFMDMGLIVLFVDIIKEDYPNLEDDVLKYMAGIVGVSEIQLNGLIITTNIHNNEFNYSLNPSFFENSDRTLIKASIRDNPTTFITGVGIYNNDNELIAFSKLTQPYKKNFETTFGLKIELYY